MDRFVLRTTAKGVCTECLLIMMITLVLTASVGKASAQSIVANGEVFIGSGAISGSQPSPLHAGTNVSVGNNSQGSLIISDGGEVIMELDNPFTPTMTSVIGVFAGSTGNVIVTGAGSIFHTGNFLT